jgi:hypothetical protein
MRTIIEVIKTPIRVETKVSAPRMSAAPIEAKNMTNQDMTPVSVRVTGLGSTKVSRAAAIFLVSLTAGLLPWARERLDGRSLAGTLGLMPPAILRNWNRLANCDAFT